MPRAVTMWRREPLVLVVVGAALGLVFAAFSTFDFAQHLDRQIHGVHCSFLPGLAGPQVGESGCQAVMMSPYSSMFRARVWGGLPISLPAMSVFAFLLFIATEITLTRRQRDRRATGFLALVTAMPAAASLIMAIIAIVNVGALCKLCVAIYVASALCLVGGVLAWRRAVRGTAAWTAPAKLVSPSGDPAWARDDASEHSDFEPEARPRLSGEAAPDARAPLRARHLALASALGVAFVAVPAAAYVLSAPDHARFVAACGTLESPQDPHSILVPFAPRPGRAPAIEILDPLCPACRTFEARLAASGLDEELDRKVVLFPLEERCNWMVTGAIHPGACVVSEAVLCAGPRASDVLGWALAEQGRIREAAASDPDAASRMVAARFPEVADCLGSAGVRARINRSLRWTVRNRLPVLTPQLYVDGVKLCDEDVDLGLDFALSRLLARRLERTPRPGSPMGEVSP